MFYCISLNNQTYSRAAVWHFFFSLFLSYLCDICWTCRVFTGVTTGVFTPPIPSSSSSLWCSPCPHTMNTLASRLQNQLSRWEEGKSNLTAATRRGDCFSSQWQRSGSPSSPCLRFYWRDRSRGVKRGKLLGCSSWTASLPQVKSHPFPPIFTLHSLSTPLPRSSWHYLSVTRRHRGLHSSPPVLQMKRNNNYGDRVALAAKLGPLGSQQHIVQPD